MEKQAIEQSLLNQRIEEMRQATNDPQQLYDLYFKLGNDIAVYTEEMNRYLSEITFMKNQYKDDFQKVAEFNRYIESSEQYLHLKVCKETINAFEHMKSSVRFKIQGIEGEIKGQY